MEAEETLAPCRRRVVAGIDEAGRGPIVGPMVMAAVVLPVDALRGLRLEGVRDSKQLSARARRELLEKIHRVAPLVVVAVHPPGLIDRVNLNLLEYETAAFLASRIVVHCSDVAAIYADAVGPPERYAAVLRKAAPGVRVVAAPKADAKYTAVAAASIVAKVVRDAFIEEYRGRYGLRGSGYPTDPETLEWIREAYQRSPEAPPPIVRRSWGTLKRVAPRWYREKKTNKAGRGGAAARTLLDYLGGKSG